VADVLKGIVGAKRIDVARYGSVCRPVGDVRSVAPAHQLHCGAAWSIAEFFQRLGPAKRPCLRFAFGKALEGAVDEGAEIPAVEVFVGGFAGGVVAAGEDYYFVIEFVGFEFFHDSLGEFGKEGQVVAGVDDQRFAGPAGKFVEVDHRADGAPDLAEVVELDGGF